MEILVLGGNGFIGSHLVSSLLEDGHTISVFDISPNPYVGEREEVTYFYGSVEDTKSLAPALDGKDAIVHLISTTVPSTSNHKMVFDIRSNLIATISLLDLMRERGIRRFVYLSSGGTVYGNPNVYPVPETYAGSPLSSYGIVKMAIEKYLLLYQRLYGIEPFIIRAANAYGERQNHLKPQGVTGHFLKNAIEGKPLEVWGDGSVRRDYIYVGDLVNMVTKGLELGVCGIFNGGGGDDFSLNEIIDLVNRVVGEDLEVKYTKGRLYDVQKVCLDIEKAQKELGWSPQIGLEEGIRKQYIWMKKMLQGNGA